jgi:hypothetical protein
MLRRSRNNKSSASSRAAKKPRKAPTRAPIDWSALNRAVFVILSLAMVVGLAAGWVYGLPRLQSRVSAQAVSQVNGTEAAPMVVRFVDLPPWFKPRLRQDLADLVRRHVTRDPLAQHELASARAALLTTGWFEAVAQVRRVGVNEIEVHGTVVDPFAFIQDKDGYHLVDRLGRLLPHRDANRPANMPVIAGVRFPRPSRPMASWDGGDVAAGLAVLRLIESRPWRGQVSVVDVGHYLSQQNLRLVTDRQTIIHWGRAPGEERTIEVPAAQKLAYLDHHFDRFKHIDRGFPSELDIRGAVASGH